MYVCGYINQYDELIICLFLYLVILGILLLFDCDGECFFFGMNYMKLRMKFRIYTYDFHRRLNQDYLDHYHVQQDV